MNENAEPQENFYRLDIIRDGNSVPHKTIKSHSVKKLLESAWREERTNRDAWAVWKEFVFVEQNIPRLLATIYPNGFKSIDGIMHVVLTREEVIIEPIPAPEKTSKTVGLIMNENTETPQENFYRLDIYLDGNGAKPHKVIKSHSVDKLIQHAWDDERDRRTTWAVWKEFAGYDTPRYLVLLYPSGFRSVVGAKQMVLKREEEVGEPIPTPENPPEQWV